MGRGREMFIGQKRFVQKFYATDKHSGGVTSSVMHETIAKRAGLTLKDAKTISDACSRLNEVMETNMFRDILAEAKTFSDVLRGLIKQSPRASSYSCKLVENPGDVSIGFRGPGVSLAINIKLLPFTDGFVIVEPSARFSGSLVASADHKELAQTLHNMLDFILRSKDIELGTELETHINELTQSINSVMYSEYKQNASNFLVQIKVILEEVAAKNPSVKYDIKMTDDRVTVSFGEYSVFVYLTFNSPEYHMQILSGGFRADNIELCADDKNVIRDVANYMSNPPSEKELRDQLRWAVSMQF